jgi:peroxiredoxin
MTEGSTYGLPPDLPVPTDDGACDRLPGRSLPALRLQSTSGRDVDLSRVGGRVVVYCYPHTGRPGEPTAEGWDAIPGARGCTPQSCSFRDRHGELRLAGVTVFGLSGDDAEWQREAAARLGLPFELLSDSEFRFTRALSLPTFEFRGRTYLRRVTLIAHGGRIDKVFYPVFPPDQNVIEVLAWLRR